MRSRSFVVLSFIFLLVVTVSAAGAKDKGTEADIANLDSAISSFPDDGRNILNGIQERRTQRDSLFPVSPLKPVHDSTERMWDSIYQATYLRMGITFNHLFQWLSDSLPDTTSYGTTTDMDFVGTWELVNRGKTTQGEIFFGVEGRWDYGTVGPQDMGFISLASAGGTANAFSAYTPTFLLRNLYWEQGSKKAGWAYRIGKITTDATLATSRHLSPTTTFLPHLGTGFFSSGYPDSGLGATGVWYPADKYRILALISNSNSDRYDFGDIGEGDFYKALEVGVKLAPITEKAGYSKVTVWHNDGTKDGRPSNANTGAEGYGVTVKVEQELSATGDIIGILRWGKSWNDSSLYNEQAGAHLLYYNPPGPARLQNDLIGIAFNWVDSVEEEARDEYNFEVFYRFPLFPGLDTRLSYQSVINPALNTEFDHASVFSLGFRTVF